MGRSGSSKAYCDFPPFPSPIYNPRVQNILFNLMDVLVFEATYSLVTC